MKPQDISEKMILFFQGNMIIQRQDWKSLAWIDYCKVSKKDPDLLMYVMGETVVDLGFLCVTSASTAVSFGPAFDLI